MKKNLIVTLVAIGLLFYSLPSSKAAVVLNSSEYIGFNVSGGEIGRITTTGFGIGISPSYALDIVGKGRFSQGLILSSLTNCGKLYTDANGNVVCGSDETGITGSGSTNYIPIWTSSSSLGNSVIYQNGGKVGIGTTSPAVDLHVYRDDTDIARIYVTGSNQGTGMVYVGQSTSYGGGIVYNGDDNPDLPFTVDAVSFFRRSGGTDYEVFYYRHNSNTVNFNGDLNMQDHSILDANNVETNAIYDPEDAYLSVADNVYFTVNGTRLYLKSKGGQTYTGIYTTSTSNRLFIRADNADDVAEFASYGLYLPKDVSTGLYVGGGIQLDYAQKGYDLKFDGTNDHSIYQGSHEAIRFLGDSSNVYFPGNVGIGTTSPGAKLDVRGAATIGDDRSSSGFLRITGTGGINYIESGTTTSSGSAADIRFTDMYAAHTWMTIKSNGNIGIGTTTPSYKLDVSGTIRARDVFGAGGKNIIIGDDVYLSDIDTANTLGIYGLQDSTKGNIKLGSNGPILYGYNGNLGIGTTSPSAKLDVNGDIQINGGSATGTYKVKGHRNFYAGDETEVSTTSTTYKEVKYFTAVFDDTYGIKPRYVNVIARIWNGASSKTTYLNVTFRGCNGIVLTTTSTSPAVVKGTIDVSSCANGLYPVDIYLKTTSGGTAYNDLIEFYYVE